MSLIDLLYPTICLHCNKPIQSHQPFCSYCLETFDLLQIEGRCSKCCSEIQSIQGVCLACRKISHPIRKLGCCFDGYGPAKSLLSTYLHGHFYLAKTIASYFVLQLNRFAFPSFDCLTIIPNYFCNPQIAVAKELAKFLGLPLYFALNRSFTRDPIFSLKKKCNIINQKVLLVDLSIENTETIHSAAWTLHQGIPEIIYAMVFCGF